jgi:antirestriction protein ArdC
MGTSAKDRKAAAESGREQKLKEVMEQLENGVQEVFESDRYKTYLNTVAKFHSYSFGNCMLIALQRPDATAVAGFTAWRDKFNRTVKKGEHGIRIIAPAPYTARVEKERLDSATGAAITGADGKALTEEVQINRVAFRTATVFDISQTEGDPLPELAVVLADDVDRYDDLYRSLQEVSPVPVAFESMQEGRHGYYHPAEKRIAIQQGMSNLQTLKTLIHEIAHARLHDIDALREAGAVRPDSRTREVQAESVAYVICQQYGLDTSEYSFGYIAGWSKDKEIAELKASLSVIRNEADAIITELDGCLAALSEERAEKDVQGPNRRQERTVPSIAKVSLDEEAADARAAVLARPLPLHTAVVQER